VVFENGVIVAIIVVIAIVENVHLLQPLRLTVTWNHGRVGAGAIVQAGGRESPVA